MKLLVARKMFPLSFTFYIFFSSLFFFMSCKKQIIKFKWNELYFHLMEENHLIFPFLFSFLNPITCHKKDFLLIFLIVLFTSSILSWIWVKFLQLNTWFRDKSHTETYFLFVVKVSYSFNFMNTFLIYFTIFFILFILHIWAFYILYKVGFKFYISHDPNDEKYKIWNHEMMIKFNFC